jgi:hypothetical protein
MTQKLKSAFFSEIENQNFKVRSIKHIQLTGILINNIHMKKDDESFLYV